MKRALNCFTVAVILAQLLPITGYAQEIPASDTVAAAIKPIEVTDIIVRSTQVNTQLRDKRTRLLTDARKNTISSRLDTLQFRMILLREDPRITRIGELNHRSLDNLKTDWSFLHRLLETEQENLSDMLQQMVDERNSLRRMLEVWELTAGVIDRESAAELVMEQIGATLKDIRETESLFAEDSKFIQEQLVKISEGVIFTNEILEEILEAEQEMTRSLLTLDSPPIWKEFARGKDTTVVFEQKRSVWDDSRAELLDFYHQFRQQIWLQLILSIVIIILIFIIFRNLRGSLPGDVTPEIKAVRNITASPLASGWLISMILTFIIYDSLTDAIVLIVTILLLPATIIILRAVISGHARKYIYWPLIAIIMVELHRIGYSDTLFSRIWLMIIILFAMLTIVLVFARKNQRELVRGIRYGQLMIAGSILVFCMLCIAFFANLAGALSLSEFFTHSVVESATILLFLYAVVASLHSVIITTIYSTYLKRSSVLQQYQELIYKRLKGIINLIAFFLGINFVLRIFTIWDPVFGWFKGILTYELAIGEMKFSAWDILLFFFIIWLTIRTSRLIRTIFEAESSLRDRMKKGTPGALSLLLRITVITIGFTLAVAAGGLQMDKLTILIGAFGVGIGFGLQNIFNNLVSGIILAFERPIKEGDIIEVGTLLGIVKEIGIRSSVIRTYDGSEVIMPNGNLISQELVNWTRSDIRRRAEVQVGVEYGTDPQTVINLLLETAKHHGKVLENPQPLALFTAFGDSSLDFRLLFWITDADIRLTVQSEMTVMVHEAIKEAGITIPFPQRDLHVKSVDPHLMDRVRMQDELAAKQRGGKQPPPAPPA